jgi:hypothetical protein
MRRGRQILADVISAMKRWRYTRPGRGESNELETSVFKSNWTEEQKRLLEQFMDDPFLMEKFFNCMAEETRQICECHLQGHTLRQVANELNMDVDLVSVRYMNGLRTAADKVLRIQDHRKEDDRRTS